MGQGSAKNLAAISGVTITGAPTTGQVLTATSANNADWQTPISMQTGTATLVSGTITISTGIRIASTSTTTIFLTLNTPSGTLGAHYTANGLVVGGPGTGAFTITSVDTSGATVTTDNSTLNYLIVG